MIKQQLVIDPVLENWATERQWELMTAWTTHGSAEKAAKALGVSKGLITHAKAAIEKKAAKQGYAPQHDLVHVLPDGLTLKGTSLRYDGAGNVEQYWNKSRQEGRADEEVTHIPDPKTISKVSTLYDQEGRVTQQWVSELPGEGRKGELWEAFAEGLKADLPKVVTTPPEREGIDGLATYLIGDHHFGMLSWKEETSEDYDLKIAESLLMKASDHLMAHGSQARNGLLIFLGDFFHYDSFSPTTPTNRNQLDTDTRYPKMVRTGIRAMRYMIEAAAKVHHKVDVIIEIGNHDLSTSIFLMEAMANIYEGDARVHIDTSPAHFHYYRFGNSLIGTHHGHGRSAKLKDLPLIMANDQAKAWGDTDYHYWFTGHVHHDQVKDFTGARVESVRVLAAPDAYAAQEGWRSKRDMKVVIFDREYGEVARYTVNPALLREEQ
jgi:hypothetical protein